MELLLTSLAKVELEAASLSTKAALISTEKRAKYVIKIHILEITRSLASLLLALALLMILNTLLAAEIIYLSLLGI